MNLGFVSAILPELDLEGVLKVASEIGYDCVEVMCWPIGVSERRYAGVTHIDASSFDRNKKRQISILCKKYGMSISGLGYYPNPLISDTKEGDVYITHIKKLIEVAAEIGIDVVNTFVGRDHTKSVEDNWPRFLEVWRDIINHADTYEVNIGIENCPMSFTADEWPGGKNLATTPAIWDKMYEDIPSARFGLNYDPSHMIIQHMDYTLPIREYEHRIHHVHAKDARIDKEMLDRHGVLSHPNLWHTPKLPGMGDVDWGRFFSYLSSSGYNGAVCVEVEDRAYEGSLESRIKALKQSHHFLRQYVVG